MADVGPSVGQLEAMFPYLPRTAVEDVLQQCGNDGQKALEALLNMGHDSLDGHGPSQEIVPCFRPPEELSGTSFELLADQDALAATPWLTPEFGSFAGLPQPVISPIVEASLASSTNPRHRQWWPAELRPPSTCAVVRQASPVAFRALSPDVPSEEGWGMPADKPCSTGGSSLTQSPPTTPLQIDGFPVAQGSTDSPSASDLEVFEALPYLAGLLSSSPTPSGTASPTGNPGSPSGSRARRPSTPEDGQPLMPHLLLDGELSPELFPNLPREAVVDILHRYDAATAMKHLMMLSHCVAEATEEEEGCGSSSREVPDEASWACDSGSSSGDEAAAEPCGEELSPLAKLELLKERFPNLPATEVQCVLMACEERLEEAAQLLGRFAEEDAARQARETEGEEVAGRVAATQLNGTQAQQSAAESCLADAAKAKLEQLCKCFPAAAPEFVEVALQSACYDIADAHKVLTDQGYEEVVEAGQPASPAQPTAAATPAPGELPGPAPLGTPSCSPPKEGMTLSERTYLRNQQIYEEERAQQHRLAQARIKCRALAEQHRQRGKYTMANQLFQQAARYQEQERQERMQASRRISKRVNSGFTESITEDLHGKHVAEVLDMVSEQIRSLPKCFSRGVKVTYITGKGLHSSNGAKIKPALMEMLADNGIPFVEGPGHVVATFTPL